MAIGAIGSCSTTDCSTEAYRPDKAQRPGEEDLSPVEEANRLAEKNGEFDADAIREQRVNPTDNAARSGLTQNLTQAAAVNQLRDNGPSTSNDTGGVEASAGGQSASGQSSNQPYQSAEAADPRFPNRGGVLDFQA
jgi:hypothetical protein